MAVTTSRGSIRFGSWAITYRITRRPGRKDIAITVRPGGHVVVSAPAGTRAARIATAVRSRAAWIIRQLDRQARFAKPQPRQFVSGESLLYCGRQYRLKVRPVATKMKSAQVACEPGRFIVHVPARWRARKRAAEIRPAMIAWYRQHAPDKLETIAARLARKLAFEPPMVRIYELKNRWASCGRGGTLRFNWRLIMAPLTLVEYVVAHEFCHLRHKDHSPAFWRLLGRLVPDHLRRREALDASGPRYTL